MMKLRYLSAMFLASTMTVQLYASDTLRVDRKVWNALRSDQTFIETVWRNPALKYFENDFSLSRLQVEGVFRKGGDNVQLQHGDGERGFAVNASSYLVLNPHSKVWGTASYRNGRRTSVKWNESSDFDRIYPYVTADTLGGDMNGEVYAFSGGYVYAVNRYTWAATLAYQATMEYRNVDPRPKNTVSDLLFTLGGSRGFSSGYRTALSLHIGKYKQDNTLSFYSALGGISIYHLTGLGMHYARFAGNNTDVLYDGFSAGGSIELLPDNKQGFSASIGYNHFGYDKQMGNLGDLTLCELSENKWNGEVGFQKQQKGIKAGLEFKKRKGTEHIFGTPNGSIYPYLSSTDNYLNRQMHLRLGGLYGRTHDNFSWNILPEIGFSDIYMKYSAPYRYMKGKQLQARLGWEGNKAFRKSSLCMKLNTGYHHCLNADQRMDSQTEEDITTPVTDNAYKLLSTRKVSASAMVRWDIPVHFIKNGGLFAQAVWEYDNYPDFTTSHCGNIAVGITF